MDLQTTVSPNERDGGYYAIKGFLFQFDITLIEVLSNPETKVQFEQIQDINYDNYVMQVKHKETQNYSASKIRKPVIQLLEIFNADESKKLNLYCYFKDKSPENKSLNLTELDSILGEEKSKYKRSLKSEFLKSFQLTFTYDYNSQFIELIELIKQLYAKGDHALAIYYHSIFRSKLLDLAIKEKNMREIMKSDLDGFITDVRKVIFHSSYADYLTNEQYVKLIRREIFTFKTPNIGNFERLFIIETNENDHIVDIQNTIFKLIKKYHRHNKSPAPFICFSAMETEKLNLIKQSLIDQGIYFNDGTLFNGDKFRIDKIVERNENKRVKIINSENLNKLVKDMRFNEVYQFHKNNLVTLNVDKNTKHIQIFTEDILQVLKMIS
ncbi:hypothetical protein ACQKIC_05920 [Peribacillus sp. NPDC046944]|uniref:hypothetical protein n=1 Tax=unclassified Peribacillus TaxID=2675266 RepID=UPI003D06A5F0